LPWKQKIAIEPELAFSQLFSGGTTEATLVHLGLRGDYALTRDFYFAAGGLLGYIENNATNEVVVGVQGGLGYRRRLTGPLNLRVEARVALWGKSENLGAFNTYSGLLGVSTALRSNRAGRPASAARSRWTKQLGISGGYASIHAPGVAGGDFTALMLPGYGGGFQGLGATGVNFPPTVFIIFPIGQKVALEPGFDIHRAQANGTTVFNGNLAARLNYAVSGGWYAALGGNLNYFKTTGADAGTRTGLNLAWGYRFPLLASLGSRVEANYTVMGDNADAGLPATNTFAVMFGVMMPLR